MSTPRYTSEGVKVTHDGYLHTCGHCGSHLCVSYGFRPQACPNCGTNNRADFAPDLPSEYLQDLAQWLSDKAAKHDSSVMATAAGRIYAVLDEIEQNEADAHRFLFRKDLDRKPLPTHAEADY